MTRKQNKSAATSSGGPSRRQRKTHNQRLIWLWIGLGFVIFLAAGFLLLRENSALPAEISVTQAYQKYQQGTFFLDVRTQAEWDQEHIAKSILIPLDELQDRMGELPKDQDIVVVCRSGARSKEGVAILKQSGFSRVTCMTGGLLAWKAAGYPTVVTSLP